MSYEDYLGGDEVILGVAPTGYRYSTDVNDSLPVTPEAVARQVYESAAFGATLAQLHGRDGSGDPAPTRLPAFGAAVRDLCEEDILVEYATGPECETDDLLSILEEGPYPDLVTTRVGPVQYGHRGTTRTSRHEVDRFIGELTDRDIKPNLLVTSGRDLQEVERLMGLSVLEDPPVVTILFGAANGTVPTPANLSALLEAVPERAHCLVRATGPNQYPLTSLAFFLGAHPIVGMEDNLFVDPETPVERNAQLVQQTAQLTQQSLREIATADRVRGLFGLDGQAARDGDITA